MTDDRIAADLRPPAGAASTADLGAFVRAQALALGFDMVGIARVTESAHGEFYRDWIAAGRHGAMDYLARPDAVARRTTPNAVHAELTSAIVVALNYFSEEAAADPSTGIVARYARGRDYHKVIKSKLLALLRAIEAHAGRELPLARAYVDTGPVLERELAQRAGLGWFGRNTMLIHPERGSYFFLGVLLLELELPADPPFTEDRCGTCRACLDACPTGALLGRDESGAPVIDARRCISYLTIELRGAIPRDLRPGIGNRIFGCDICQEVCPWNERFARPSEEPAYRPRADLDAPALVALAERVLAVDEAGFRVLFAGSPLRRAKRDGLLRNVCVALGNWGSEEAIPILVRALGDASPLVRAHAAWALGRVGCEGAAEALRGRLASEADPEVLGELTAALAAPRVS